MRLLYKERALLQEESHMTGWGEVKASLHDRVITINGYISLSTISAVARAIRNMQRHNLDPIITIIGNSHGGCAISGQMIFGILQNTVAPVHTVVEQFAWSAAFYIFLAGQKRVMFNNARVGPHSMTITHFKDISRDFVEQHRDLMYTWKFNERLYSIIRSVINISHDEIEKICLTKKIFSANEALKLGVATDIVLEKDFYDSQPRDKRSPRKAKLKKK